MASPFRFLRAIVSALLLHAALGLPLRAQLDPRLQQSKTDLLNLYQQSTNIKLRPEIATPLDFSGSMRALMFHPAYRNQDISDAGFPGETLTIALTGGTAGNNTYTFTAKSIQNTNAFATITLTVNGTAGASLNSAWRSTRVNFGNGYRYLWTQVQAITVTPVGTISTGTVYTLTAKVAMRVTSTYSPTGTAANLDDYISGCSCTLNGGLTWTVTGGAFATTLTPTSTSPGAVSPTNISSWTSAAQSTVWTAPNYDPGTPPAVTGWFSTTSTTFVALVKPNGAVVTSSDANTLSPGNIPSTGLNGTATSPANTDIRNWVRAASHVRMAYLDGSTTRTLDIPIPWKIHDANSTGNPLSSVTAADPVVTTMNPNGTTSSYGSGQNIEIDQAYKITGGTEILSDDIPGTQVSLQHTGYHTVYLQWLFTGKYTDGPYAGKYIAYDSFNAALVGGQGSATWGQGYGTGIPAGQTITVPTYGEALNGQPRPYLGTATVAASSYIIPARTRVQAVKEAVIRTWIKYQNDVYWAFRFLDDNYEPSTFNNNSQAQMWNTTAPDTTSASYGNDSGWFLFNGNSLTGMSRLSFLLEGTSTPLTYAMARTLAQFTDPNSVFNAVETGANKASQCMSHFIILFTDGRDNVGPISTTSPYINSTTQMGNAWDGNHGILSNKTAINPSGGLVNYWNVFTYAGIGAHLADTSIKDTNGVYWFMNPPAAYPSTNTSQDQLLPYAIIERGTPASTNHVSFAVKPHRVTTMTVGVSLGGTYLDPSAPKGILFTAAAAGDPTSTSWNLSNLLPFDWIPDPQDPTRKLRKSGTLYFFDGSNPTTLLNSIDIAVQQTTLPSNINAVSNPNIPFIGASFGKQVYLGKFRPPSSGGAVWPGDLMMFGTKEVSGQTQIIDKNGNPTATLDSTTAQWSAFTALSANRLWSARNLYTRRPGTLALPEPGLQAFTDTGTGFTDPSTGLRNFVAASLSADAAKQGVIQYAAGGNTTGPLDASNRPTTNRSTIMGDIINSAPAPIEYTFADVQGGLTSALRSVTGANRFRLILVGTNQGWLHAFGETTVIKNDATTGFQDVTTGAVDELWSFMPTDFLANLDYITNSTNPHVFMADGSPAIYHLDLPPSTGGAGNGTVDVASERAVVIFGLRKGGRSYYAIDIHNPYSPVLRWSLVPDEAANFPDSRNLSSMSGATVRSIIANMGFSTCTPAFARVQFGNQLRDVVFFGGGYSNDNTDHNFPTYPPPATQKTLLGRSVLVLDVYTGEVLAAADMTAISSTIGPIAAGVVPFEYILNSGMAQRAYFLDYKGGLWSWGTKQVVSTAPYVDFRNDTSDLKSWTNGSTNTITGIRKVAQDGSGANNSRYTTLPAPFRVGSFPGVANSKNTGSANPSAVGIAMVSGDRNNPLDYGYDSSDVMPDHHRLTVIFDRQDSRTWNLDSNSGPDTGVADSQLMNFTGKTDSVSIVPGFSDYYLAPATESATKFGYYVNFPVAGGGFVAKGINEPLVVARSLFYSYFQPTQADLCTGGNGNTYSYLICDVINPIVNDPSSSKACISGMKFTWTGVSSNFIAYGTRGTIQGGAIPVANPQPGASKTTMQLNTILGRQQERFPKARVWRTVR